MAAPQFKDNRSIDQLSQIIGKYDPSSPVLFTIPDPAGGPGNTIDVNSLPEQAVDQLIQQYGGHGPLIGRKSFLEATRRKNEIENPVLTPEQESEKRINALSGRLDELYDTQQGAAVDELNRNFDRQRERTLSEEIAMGRSLKDPVTNKSVGRLEESRGNALSQLLGGMAGARAGDLSDLARTTEGLLQQNRQFNQEFELGKNQFQAGLNEKAADRSLSKYLSEAQMRHQRDMAAPEEWEKQLGRVKGITGIATDIFNTGSKAYQQNKENKMLSQYLATL